MNNPAAAAIEYALSDDDPVAFLRCWFEGNFDALRNEWENVPEEVFIGADPLRPETNRMIAVDELSVVPDDCWRRAVMEIGDTGFGAAFKYLLAERAAELHHHRGR